MTNVDPITFEIIRHRLFRTIEEAVITLKQVSGSATTNEGHDLMVSLYTRDGELLMGGVGFLHHLTSAAEACKAIIRRFGDEIAQGDIYLLNDPYTAALHTSDVYLVSPIHYRGELIAWSACFVHVNDIGAINPGGFSPQARDIFSEGFSSPGIRIVSQGRVCGDVLDTLLNMVRSPEMVALDIRSMIACNNVARERLLVLIDRYGLEAFTTVSTTLIRRSQELLEDRLRRLPDGCWQARQYMDVEGEPAVIMLTLRKSGARLVFDFEGSSPQSKYGVNCTRWAAWGGLLAPVFPLLCHDITWNEGLLRPIEMKAEPGLIVNCRRPAPVSIATTAAVQAVNNASLLCLSKVLAASDLFRAESTAVWHGSHLCLYQFGKNQHGQDVIGSTTETFGGSGGGRYLRDGIDIGGEIPNPISRMANVETNEANMPIRYLFRRRLQDSGGAGRFRGGTGGEYAWVVHDAPDGRFGFVVSGKGVDFPMAHGLSGGYPGAPGRYVVVRDMTVCGEYAPTHFEDINGRREPVSWGVYDVGPRDAFYVRWNGGGGYGDPLERDPEAVGRDVADGTVSQEAARNLYGVILADGEVDLPATAAARAAMRMRPDRKREHGPTPQLSTSLLYSPREAGGRIACRGCGHDLGAASDCWKERARVLERPLRELAAVYTTGPDALLREFVCPTCGLGLDSEVARRDDPPLVEYFHVTP
jgi:N-methylhydantoinase B